MTTNEAKEVLNGIRSYENTMDLIENHSVSVQDACAIGINAIEEVNRYKKAIDELRTEVSKISERSAIRDTSGKCYGERIANPKEIKEKVLSIIDKYFKE